MKINQVSVFLENRKGRLSEVCSLLASKSVNIRALTIAESEDFGILRVVVDKPEDTLRILKENHFVANLTDIVAVQVPDKPGGLAVVLKTLSDADVNVEYMYGFVEKVGDAALLVFRFEDPDKAIKVLQKNEIRVIGKQEILSL